MTPLENRRFAVTRLLGAFPRRVQTVPTDSSTIACTAPKTTVPRAWSSSYLSTFAYVCTSAAVGSWLLSSGNLAVRSKPLDD